eukprot:scaffold90617_cov37-Prasinocladus_malaysianus.AAC.1
MQILRVCNPTGSVEFLAVRQERAGNEWAVSLHQGTAVGCRAGPRFAMAHVHHLHIQRRGRDTGAAPAGETEPTADFHCRAQDHRRAGNPSRRVAAIEDGFKKANEAPRHPRNPALRPVQSLPLLPDFRNWPNSYLLVNFDNDPMEDHEQLSTLTPNQRKVGTISFLFVSSALYFTQGVLVKEADNIHIHMSRVLSERGVFKTFSTGEQNFFGYMVPK